MMRRDQGFTLIEVLVALAILSVSLAVLLRVFSANLHRAQESQNETIASTAAESLLASVGSQILLHDGTVNGQLDNGFRWFVQIEPYGDGADAQAWPLAAKKVSAVVSWFDGSTERSVSLTTLELAPLEKAQ